VAGPTPKVRDADQLNVTGSVTVSTRMPPARPPGSWIPVQLSLAQGSWDLSSAVVSEGPRFWIQCLVDNRTRENLALVADTFADLARGI
jgi:hypothetical protein